MDNLRAVARDGGDHPARATEVRAQLTALFDATRLGLSSIVAPVDIGGPMPLPASGDGSVVTVLFDEGRARMLERLPADPILGRRYAYYARFLALVALLSPRLAGWVRLHLRDEHADAPGGSGFELVFNRRHGASEAFVVVPDAHFVHHRGYRALRRRLAARGLPWEQRRPLAFWRGSSTGGSLGVLDDPLGNARVRLCRFSRAHPHLVDARLGRVVDCHERQRRWLHAEGLVDRFVPPEEQIASRYLISVDGWAAEWEGMVWKLASGSTLLMVESAWEPWHGRGLVPFVHYVPVRADLGDLAERIAWCRAHDEACRDMAREAMSYANRELTFAAAVRFCQAQLGLK
jgi:hypothetical protein